MRTLVVEYEDIRIELARPTISDGQVRKQMWREYRRLINGDPLLISATNLFPCIITQIVSSVNFPFEKISGCPDDETLMSELKRFMDTTDEMLADKLSAAVSDLNGYTKSTEELQKKILSESSSSVTSETPVPTPIP